MKIFHQIVCAVDFSDTSSDALRYAAMLAHCSSAHLHVVHATYVETPSYFLHSQLDQMQNESNRVREAAHKALSAFVERVVDKEVRQSVTLLEEPVAEAVRAYAEAISADLLVIGTHGRSGWNRLLLGSVAEKLIRLSNVPVLTVRTGKNANSVANILCAVNDSPVARHALQLAGRLAECTQARLIVIQIHEEGATGSVADVCNWVSADNQMTCEVKQISRPGDPATEIIKAAVETHADLIVIGATHKRFADATVLGSTTVRVTRHAPAPVLLAFSAGSRADTPTTGAAHGRD